MFQTFRGSPALSEFRIQGLMQKFQQNQLPVKSVYAEYLHFVELNRPLVSEQEAKLKALLHYGPTLAEHDAKGETFIVIPRVGTISSWSSKATDIAHNCGLNEVERIERGLAYYFELSQPLDEKTTEKLTALSSWDLHSTHEAIEQTAAELEVGMGKVGMPLRVAVTGSGQSPSMDVTLVGIGRERVLARIQRAIDFIKSQNA